jgi:membrane protease YdiL (CAAX protease family)
LARLFLFVQKYLIGGPMRDTMTYLVGLTLTVLLSGVVLGFLRRSLRETLVDRESPHSRAALWASYFAVMLFVVPVLFALFTQPLGYNPKDPVFQVARQLAWALLGLLSLLLVVGKLMRRRPPRPVAPPPPVMPPFGNQVPPGARP